MNVSPEDQSCLLEKHDFKKSSSGLFILLLVCHSIENDVGGGRLESFIFTLDILTREIQSDQRKGQLQSALFSLIYVREKLLFVSGQHALILFI